MYPEPLHKEVCKWDKFEDLNTKWPKIDWACYYAEPALELWMISPNKNYNPNSRVRKWEALKMIMKARWLDWYDYGKWREWEWYVDSAVDAGILLKDPIAPELKIIKSFTDYKAQATRWFVFAISINQVENTSLTLEEECEINPDQKKCVEDKDSMCLVLCQLSGSCSSCYCGENNENSEYQICKDYCSENPDDEGCLIEEDPCIIDPEQDQCSCEDYPNADKCYIEETCENNPDQEKCPCDDYPEKEWCTIETSWNLTVKLSPNTAPAATIPWWISWFAAVTYDFTAGEEDATITSMTIQRNGISDWDTLTALALFSENGRISKQKDDNQENNTQAQINLNNGWYTIPARTTQSITVVVNIEEIANKDEVEADEFMLELVKVELWWEIEYKWNLEWNKITIWSRDAALIKIKKDQEVSDVTVWDEKAEVLKFKVEWAANEDIKLEFITFKAWDSEALENLQNFVLMLDWEELAYGTVSGKYITFAIDGWVTISEDKTENFVVLADVVWWAWDTYSFYIEQELDVRCVWQQFGYGLGVDISEADSEGELWDVTIEAGELALLDIDAEHDKIRADKENVELGQLKIMNIAGQNLELQKFGLKVQLSNTTNVLEEVFTNFEIYNPETGETYELSTNDGELVMGTYSDDGIDISLPEGDVTYIIRADTLEDVKAWTEVKLSLAIDWISSTWNFYAEETDEDTQVTDITPSSLSWKKVTFIDSWASVANVPLADTTVVRGAKWEVAMQFEIESSEASDIQVDEIVARLTTQEKLLKVWPMSSIWANQQTDLIVTKVPFVEWWETYHILKDWMEIVAKYTTQPWDTIEEVTLDLKADLEALWYNAEIISWWTATAQEDIIDWLAWDPLDQYKVTIDGIDYVEAFNTGGTGEFCFLLCVLDNTCESCFFAWVEDTYSALASQINSDPFSKVTAIPTSTDITLVADTSWIPFNTTASAIDGNNIVATYSSLGILYNDSFNREAVQATVTADYIDLVDPLFTGISDVTAEEANGSVGDFSNLFGYEVSVDVDEIVDENGVDDSYVQASLSIRYVVEVEIFNDDADTAVANSLSAWDLIATADITWAAANGYIVDIVTGGADTTGVVISWETTSTITATVETDWWWTIDPTWQDVVDALNLGGVFEATLSTTNGTDTVVLADAQTLTLAWWFDAVVHTKQDVIDAINILLVNTPASLNASAIGTDPATNVAEKALTGWKNALSQVSILYDLKWGSFDYYTVSIDPDWVWPIGTSTSTVLYTTDIETTLGLIATEINDELWVGTAVVNLPDDMLITAPVPWIPFTLDITPHDYPQVTATIDSHTDTPNSTWDSYIRVISPDMLSFPAWQWNRMAQEIPWEYTVTLTAQSTIAPNGTYGVEINGQTFTSTTFTSLINILNSSAWWWKGSWWWVPTWVFASTMVTSTDWTVSTTLTSNSPFTINNTPTTAMSSPVAATNQEIAKISLYADTIESEPLDEKSWTDIASDGTVTFKVDEDILSDTRNTYYITIDIVDWSDAVENTPIIVDLVWVNAEDDDNDTVKVLLKWTTTELSKTESLPTESPLYSDKETTVTETWVLIISADWNNEDNKAAKNILWWNSKVIYSTDILALNEEIEIETVKFTIPWQNLSKALKNASIYLEDTLIDTNTSSKIVWNGTSTIITFDNITGLIIPKESKELRLSVQTNTIGYEKIWEIISSANISQVDITNAQWINSWKEVLDQSLTTTQSNTFDIVPAQVTTSVLTTFWSESDLKLTVDAWANTNVSDNTSTKVKIDRLTFNELWPDKNAVTYSIKDSKDVLLDSTIAVWWIVTFDLSALTWTDYSISNNETFTISIDSWTTKGNSYWLELQRTGVIYTTSTDSYSTLIDSNYADEIELWEYNAQ